MKIKAILILLSTVLLCEICYASPKEKFKLSESVWTTCSNSEYNGQPGTIVKSLYFTSDKDVIIYSAVVSSDGKTIVSPFEYAKGEYSVSGNPRKEATVEIKLLTVDNKDVKYSGKYKKRRAMIIVPENGCIEIYGYNKNVK